jgi:leucyl aminopeptidase
MQCISCPSPEKRPRTDGCVLPFAFDEANHPVPLFDDPPLLRACHRLLATKDFTAKEGEVLIQYLDPVAEDRLIVLGVGERRSVSIDGLKASYARLAAHLAMKHVATITCLPPVFEAISHRAVLQSILEGLWYGRYVFDDYRSKKADDPHGIREAVIVTEAPNLLSEVDHDVRAVMTAVAMARDLVNQNADQMTPEGFAQAARLLATTNLHVTVHEKEWLEHERMNLLLTVGRGASYEPRCVTVEWKGAANDSDLTVLIGKGITFDTGGLNLKLENHMGTMKSDMAGAAAVLGTMRAVRDLRLPLNITAIIPLCENSIGSRAYKPGDVYTARSGKSVEIMSTDAEGRLILADAIDYAVTQLRPSRIVDVATLTGSAEVALGKDISALISNTDSLAFLLERAAHQAGDPIWRLPLYRPYEPLLDSDIADCKNVATRSGGAINAALFLHFFVGDVAWAHIDIAGTAFLKEPFRYYRKGATGVPIRTLIEFFRLLLSKGEE